MLGFLEKARISRQSQESRGLGDVYKRQPRNWQIENPKFLSQKFSISTN